MDKVSRFFCLIFVFFAASAVAEIGAADSCPVTIPGTPSIDGPFGPPAQFAWYGSDALSVLIPKNGKWTGMGPEHNYRDKQWWWSADYDGRTDQNLGLIVTGRRIDDPSIAADISEATAGSRDDWPGPVMLVAVEFPTVGCWEIRGEYRGQVVTFVVEILSTLPGSD